MLINYFKIAIAVLKRRKFFTFISLFGISFTLMMLIVMTAFIDKVVNDNYPDKKRDRLLYINTLEESGPQAMNSGMLSYYYLTHYAGSLKMPVKMAIASNYTGTNTYINDKKLVINFKYTNAEYWDLLDYNFVEGRPFTKQQADNSEAVTVITEDIKKKYFGDVPSVVGRYIEANNVHYRVCGVVKNVPVTNYMLYSDIYLPVTLAHIDRTNTSYRGDYIGILLAPTPADVPAIQKEYEDMVKRLPISNRNEYDHIYSHADPFILAYLRTGNEKKSGLGYALTAIGIFVLLVMLLPTLNLININITRIMERSSEIGVRKAFGASSHTLTVQFLVENLILTLLGGIIGVLLSFIVLQLINNARLIENLTLTINFTVLSIALLACLVFGLLSGVYPAWRMSRLNVVIALKEQ
jgi:putative ABC transport system permease protein